MFFRARRLKRDSMKWSTGVQPNQIIFSIGVTTRTLAAKEYPFDLITRADRALYLAKADGRDCVRHSDQLPPV